MPRVTYRRYEQILTQMIAKVVTRTDLSDIADSATVKHILAAAASEDDEQYYQMQLLRDLFSIDTATGDDLDERAAEIQPGDLTRIAAVKASGNVVFTRPGTTGTTTIAIGTKVKTADGQVFTTTIVGTITAASPQQIAGHGVGRDSNLVSVVADVAGTDGNVTLNTIIKFVQLPTGVNEVTNPAACTNGLDEETDAAFRTRLRNYIAALARSTVNAIETYVLGAQDESTGATILYSKAIEDEVNRGNVTLYIDDGTGSAVSSDTSTGTTVAADFTWNGTTTVTSADTSEVAVDDYIGFIADANKNLFRITAVTAGVSVTITNPGALTIPTGSGASGSMINPDNLCEGLSGPPADHAVGGEESLYTDNYPIRSTSAYYFVSSTRGLLVENTDYTLNPANGHVVFLIALTAGEAVFGWSYLHYTGLIALAQKIVDGDPSDRTTYPGVRAAGVRVTVLTPTVVNPTVTATLVIDDGYDHATVIAGAEQQIMSYINSLPISGDVLLSELIAGIMSVAGVYNVTLSLPAADVAIADDEIARILIGSITVS